MVPQFPGVLVFDPLDCCLEEDSLCSWVQLVGIMILLSWGNQLYPQVFCNENLWYKIGASFSGCDSQNLAITSTSMFLGAYFSFLSSEMSQNYWIILLF